MVQIQFIKEKRVKIDELIKELILKGENPAELAVINETMWYLKQIIEEAAGY